MSRQLEIFVKEAPGALNLHWGWLVALGGVLAFLGILAIWRARAATLIYVGFLGAVLLVGSVAVLVFAFTLTGYWADFFIHVLWAFLLAVIGFVLLTRPTLSAEAITLAISFYLITAGVLYIGYALMSHIQGEWYYAFEGLVSAFLGVLLLVGWPITGFFAIGLFIGIDLLMKGAAIVALGLRLRGLAQ
jgi:uncharacterized membrane protein HdeD (DUF308 family)